MIKIRGIDVKTSLKEMTLKEYNDVVQTLSDGELNRLEKWMRLLYICGLKDEKTLSEIRVSDVDLFVNSLNENYKELKDFGFTRKIDVANRTYIAHDEDSDFEPTFKDLQMIETNTIKENRYNLIYVSAVIFKDEKLTHKEHYAEAHIKHKMSLFANLPAIDFVPYVLKIQQEAVFNTLENKESNELETILKAIENAKIAE